MEYEINQKAKQYMFNKNKFKNPSYFYYSAIVITLECIKFKLNAL